MVFGVTPPPCDSPALFDSSRGRWYTYGELADAVARVGEALTGSQKALAFCFATNDIGSIVGYLATLGRDHAVALIDRKLPAATKASLLDKYEPEFVVESSLGPSALQGVQNHAYRETACEFVRVWRRPRVANAPVHPDLAVLLSTSGSTGSPKFVRLSRQNIVSNAFAICKALGITADDCAVTTLPIHYAYGLSVLNSHLAAGARLAITGESVLAPGLWALMRDASCTSLAGVPYTFQMLGRIGFDRFDVPSLKTLTQAGGRLADDLILRFHRTMDARRGRFIVMYGQTEATARMTCLPSEYLPEKVGSVGMAIPGGKLWIEPGDGSVSDQAEEGEVVFQGPNVMLGYAYGRSDLSRGDALGGTLHTGDLGRVDSDGLLRVVGRNDRMAKVFGVRLNLDEVEQQLKAHGPAAVVSCDNKLVVFCEYGDDRLFAKYRRELSARLQIHHTAFEFHRVQSLPRTDSGKTDYYRLRFA